MIMNMRFGPNRLRSMKAIAFVVIGAILTGCSDSPSDLVRSARSITIYAVDPSGTDVRKLSPDKEYFDGSHEVLAKAEITNPKTIAQIADALHLSLQNEFGPNDAAKCFLPRHGIAREHHKISICFECQRLYLDGELFLIDEDGKDLINEIWAEQGLQVAPPTGSDSVPHRAASPLASLNQGDNLPGKHASAARPDDPLVLFEGFDQLAPMEQRGFIASTQSNYDLPKGDAQFLVSLIGDKSLSETTRNNIANILVAQNRKDPKLYKTLLAMVDDEAESPLWRDYALQHLATTYSFASDPKTIESKLRSIVGASNGSIAGTALILLDDLESDGHIKVPELEQWAVEKLENSKSALPTRTSALALLGKRFSEKHVELVRQYAAQDKTPSLKRVAIAALGNIGQKEDLAIVQGNLKNPDKSVAMAAKGAEKKLRHRVEQLGK